MFNRRILISFFFMTLMASPSGSVTFDYTTVWTNLSDKILPHFLYDCGGLVDVAVKGNTAYTIGSHYGLQIVDCTDPLDYSYRGYLGISSGSPRRCDVWNHYVYLINGQARITVIDVDDHDSPVQVNQIEVGVSLNDVLVVGPWLYVALGNGTLQIYNLASAENPPLVNTITLPMGHAERLAHDGDRVVAAGDDGLVVINAAVPSWPSIAGSYAFEGNTQDLSVRNGLAVVGQNDQSLLLDYSDPGNITVTNALADTGHGVLLTSNNQMWLGRDSCWHQGAVRIYDVSDPSSPIWLHDEIEGFRGYPSAMVEYQGLIFAGEFMCWCAGEWPGFHIFKVGDLPLPQPLATASYDNGNGIIHNGSRVELATRQGLVSLDVSNPYDPQTLQVLDPDNGYWWPVEDEGTVVAFRLEPNQGLWLQVLTRDTQGNLQRRGKIPVSSNIRCLDLKGSVAMAGFPNGVLVVDVSNPESPEIVTELFVGENVISIARHGDLAAVWMSGSTNIFDLSDLANPLLLSSWEAGSQYEPQFYRFVERSGRLVLLVSETGNDFDYYGGLAEVYDVTEPTDPVCLLSLRQLGWDMVGPLILDDEMLIVPGSREMTFYHWPALDEPAEFHGRLQFPHEFFDWWNSWAVVTDQTIVSLSRTGYMGTWPLPVRMLSDVSEDDSTPLPKTLTVSSVPNPFNPSCEIHFSMPADGEISVEVFDVQGRRVRSLLKANAYAGPHSVRWDGRDGSGQMVAAGVYLVRIGMGQFSTSTKLTLAK